MKCVIPIAGLGSRMFPFTASVAKAFLPLVDGSSGLVKPFLHTLVEDVLTQTGGRVCSVCIVLSPDQEDMISAYFGLSSRPAFDAHWAPYVAKGEAFQSEVEAIYSLGRRIVVAVQDVPRGFGHAVLCGAEYVGDDEYFLVCLGDHIYTSAAPNSCLAQLLDAFEDHGEGMCMTSVGRDALGRAPVTGVLIAHQTEVDRVVSITGMLEKPDVETARDMALTPEGDILVNFGIDILPGKPLFDMLASQGQTKSGEIELRVGQKEVMETFGMKGFIVDGLQHDTGLPHAYMDALVSHYLYTSGRPQPSSHTGSGSTPVTESVGQGEVRLGTGCAPGRVDVMGGVADYSGALVLQAPTSFDRSNVATLSWMPSAQIEGIEGDDNGGTVLVLRTSHAGAGNGAGQTVVPLEPVLALSSYSDADLAPITGELPVWAKYMLSPLIVWVVEGVLTQSGQSALSSEGPSPTHVLVLSVTSTLPQGKGLASSASVEVAVAKALRSGLGMEREMDDKTLALLCQKGENYVVGAPCGVMDQLAVGMGVPGTLLAILCQPAEVEGIVAIPPGLVFVDIDSGAKHELAEGGASPYSVVRAAAFMGAKILGVDCLVSQVPLPGLDDVLATLPETLLGSAFLEQYGPHVDPVTSVDPEVLYPIRASVNHAIREHGRVELFRELLGIPRPSKRTKELLGRLMLESHASYTSIGLNSPACDAIVGRVVAMDGVYGAKITGGGCGGTVVVLCDQRVEDDVLQM